MNKINQTRRKFFFLGGAGFLAFMYNACGGGFKLLEPAATGNDPFASSAPTGSGPVWDEVPTLNFTVGVPSRISIAPFVHDAAKFNLKITKNPLPLPVGVTYDEATKSFVYDGSGGVTTSEGHILLATEV